jgi:ABC-type uncharacterized transport system substrate-binding protein
MRNSDSIKHSILAAMASVVLTATAVGAAVGPARAIETAPVVYAAVEGGTAARG